MRTAWFPALWLGVSCLAAQPGGKPSDEVRLVIVDPGHYHASLIQKEMYPRVAPRVAVYAPLAPELFDYLNRVSLFNLRPENPTRWELDVHTGAGYFERMLDEHPGNVAVFAGRNRGKIDRIAACLRAGLSVLADKPWIVHSSEMPALAAALDIAERKGLVGYDVMTERFEITSLLEREIVNTRAVFGQLVPGSREEPAITAKSIHHLMKVVAGVPLRRPSWFLNIDDNGEGIADVGTHVVDLVQWTAFPNQRVELGEIRMNAARRWPTVITREMFSRLTGEPGFSTHLAKWVEGGEFRYFCNTRAEYAVRGVNIRLDILWNWEAPEGAGDSYESTFRGSLAEVAIRQGNAEKFRPELYVKPAAGAQAGAVLGALKQKVAQLQTAWPGVAVEVNGSEAHVLIPERYRVTHEDHFAQVTRAFLGYLANPASLPAWEKSNMLAKYSICTKAVELSRER